MAIYSDDDDHVDRCINIIPYSVPLRASRRLRLSSPKRHTFRLPSDVIRSLLHVPQKCSLMEVMKPTLIVIVIEPEQDRL